MRQPVPLQLVLAMALAPLVAGMVGGMLVCLGLALQLAAEFTIIEALQTGLAMSIFGVIIAVFVCYAFGSPLMLAAWAIAHFAKWRSPVGMGLVMGLTGLLFAILFFYNGRLFLEDFEYDAAIALLVTLPAGFAAGYLAGWLIGQLGYRDAPAGSGA
ncbi:MAG: hypothetical protein ACQRW7_11085 [Caulobacterales bacterium]|uniref:hypothetical protein n=1 Tax=Glycocaulis sp. TaxID=1969725 RepID=UPI003F9ECD81